MIDLSPLRLINSSKVRNEIESVLHSSSEYDGKISLNEELSSNDTLFVDQTTPSNCDTGEMSVGEDNTILSCLSITRDCLLLRPIWDLPVLMLTYECEDRKTAKKLAKHIAQELCVKRLSDDGNELSTRYMDKASEKLQRANKSKNSAKKGGGKKSKAKRHMKYREEKDDDVYDIGGLQYFS